MAGRAGGAEVSEGAWERLPTESAGTFFRRPGGPPTVLLIPGLGCPATDCFTAAGSSALAGRRLMVWEPPGASHTPYDRAAHGDLPALVAFLAEALGAVREGADRPVVVGHSLGGLVGFLLAEEHPWKSWPRPATLKVGATRRPWTGWRRREPTGTTAARWYPCPARASGYADAAGSTSNSSVTVYQVDVFTRRLLAGNPAGVVPDATGLTPDTMQAIAREMALSETAFVLPADGDDHDFRVRFFTPATEVPSCGHATVATGHVLHRLGRMPKHGCTLSVPAGLMRLAVAKTREGDTTVTMHQNPPAFADPLGPEDAAALYDALGASPPNASAPWALPVQWVNTGNPKIVVPVADRAMLDALNPRMDALMDIHRRHPCGGYYVFTLADPDAGVTAHARMFAPQIGIPEDPVTGNGAGPLGAYLTLHGQVTDRDGSARVRVRQGEAMDRPGTVDVAVDVRDGRPVAVAITGNARVAFQASLALPDGARG